MSVYIKGIKPPKNCDECDWSFDCARSDHIDGYEMLGGRPWGCPMVEVPPHGRLIDADKYEFPGDLKDEPTIIPAEEG